MSKKKEIKAKNNLVVGYVRVSTTKQEKHGMSLGGQTELIKKYCLNNGLELVNVYEEQSSGANNSRALLTQAIADVKENGGSLMVASLDRLARDQGKVYAVLSMVPVVFIDLNGHDSKEMIAFTALMASMELEKISLRSLAGYVNRRRKNLAMGLPENHGFGRIHLKENEHLRAKGAMMSAEKNKAEAKERHKGVVAIIKLLIQANKGVFAIKDAVKYLNDNGHRTGSGGAIDSKYVHRLHSKYITGTEYTKNNIKNAITVLPVGTTIKEYIQSDPNEYATSLYNSGNSLAQISKLFNEYGARTKTGGLFYAQTIRRFIDGEQTGAYIQEIKEHKGNQKLETYDGIVFYGKGVTKITRNTSGVLNE